MRERDDIIKSINLFFVVVVYVLLMLYDFTVNVQRKYETKVKPTYTSLEFLLSTKKNQSTLDESTPFSVTQWSSREWI